MGLDSGTHTGYAVLDQSGQKLQLGAQDFSKLPRFERWAQMRDWMVAILAMWKPRLVVIEGYGFGNVNSLATLVEYGTIYRQVLLDHAINFIEVPPTSIKAFITKGGAKKDEMRLAAYKKWGIEHSSNDAVDAYVMAQFGRAVLGVEKITVEQLKTLHKVAGVKFLMAAAQS